ncbi:hypothetical protein BDZ45DRAFT_746198 [Acephala macrosclerotiorum]|nr:hypothetical protein BDZ45DRAFT_746198 [Acephala macrosclerotiorum]
MPALINKTTLSWPGLAGFQQINSILISSKLRTILNLFLVSNKMRIIEPPILMLLSADDINTDSSMARIGTIHHDTSHPFPPGFPSIPRTSTLRRRSKTGAKYWQGDWLRRFTGSYGIESRSRVSLNVTHCRGKREEEQERDRPSLAAGSVLRIPNSGDYIFGYIQTLPESATKDDFEGAFRISANGATFVAPTGIGVFGSKNDIPVFSALESTKGVLGSTSEELGLYFELVNLPPA